MFERKRLKGGLKRRDLRHKFASVVAMAKDLAARTVLAAASTIFWRSLPAMCRLATKTQQLRVEGLAAQGSRVDCGFCHPERPRAE